MKKNAQVATEHISILKRRMERIAGRNPSWGFKRTDYKRLYEYLSVQLLTFLQDDELFELLVFTDHNVTGKQEESLDAYLILDQGNEIELKLFQFKYSETYKGGVSTKELYAFVDRMNRVFLRSDLQDEKTLEAFAEVRMAVDEARKTNRRAKRVRIQCYYIVNGQNVSHTDASKVDEIRQYFAADRQAYGFTFETYGAIDFYNLVTQGRVPIVEETLEINTERSPEPYLLHEIGPNPNGMPIKVLVGFANVNQFTRLVDRYSNNELFELNVRYFLGTGKEVNRRIIGTVTSDHSSWFGFMNNGVSITADEVVVDGSRSGGRMRIRLSNMQIINGCQTVNALYHAKYSTDLKDKFQGNSNVMVRIYEIDPANREFLDALIIATNSQNAIRPQDLVANDPTQIALQRLFAEYGVGYERKTGEDLPGVGYSHVFSKEDAAMSYLGVIEGQPSKLRNSLSIRELFGRDKEYFRVFNLQGDSADDDYEDAAKAIGKEFTPGSTARTRALQIFTAWAIREACKGKIAASKNKNIKGALRKGTYFVAWLIFIAEAGVLTDHITKQAENDPSPNSIRDLMTLLGKSVERYYAAASNHFTAKRAEFIENHGGNEDSALKNTAFTKFLTESWPQAAGGADLFDSKVSD
ncbi:MAG: AIPR family protein [Verrucomicrobia bacterium]|nr:AIPR family protein [Verrucomicrobiota bacterium]